MILNDDSKVASECCHNFGASLMASITLLESQFMLLELSLMLLENTHSAGITHDTCKTTVSIFYWNYFIVYSQPSV
jgi:hypothetical protein